MAVSFDKIDFEIIRALLDDGRVSYAKIAKRVNLTDVAIKKRVESLKRRGIINSITVELNYSVLGLESTLFVQIRCDASKINDIMKRLSLIEYVTETYKVIGEYNLFVKLLLPKLELADRFISKLAAIDGINDIKTMVVLSKHKNSSSLPALITQNKL